jgi:hypothetical protein
MVWPFHYYYIDCSTAYTNRLGVEAGEQPICKLALNDKAVFQHCLILQVLDTGDLVVFCISASTSGASPPDACFSPYLPMRSSETRATALLLMKPIS